MIRFLLHGFAILLAFAAPLELSADVLVVPDEYPTIQGAVNAASEGDTVLVQRGTYYESLSVPAMSVLIASPYLFSSDTTDRVETILYPAGDPPSGRNLQAITGTTSDSLRLVGLTFQGNGVGNISTGGIRVSNRTVLLEQCTFTSCYDTSGGALSAYNGVLRVKECSFENVGSYSNGAFASLEETHAVFSECDFESAFIDNENYGNYIWVSSDSVLFTHCRITNLGHDHLFGAHFIYPHDASSYMRFTKCEILDNRFHTFFAPEYFAALSPAHIEFDSNLVQGNQFFNPLFSTTDFDRGTIAIFNDNEFENNTGLSDPSFGCRQFFSLSGDECTVIVRGNLFHGNSSNEYSVALLLDLDPEQVSFESNYIIGNTTHDAVGNPPGGAIVMIDVRDGVFRNNVLAGNSPYAVFQGLLSFPPSYARSCSWGHETGPYDADENPFGLGDSVGEAITVTPWYYDSTFSAIGIGGRPESPSRVTLIAAYPNPFNSTLSISLSVPFHQEALITLYDLLGREVDVIHRGRLESTMLNYTAPASLASGIYFLHVQAGAQTAMQKMVLLK